MRTSPTPISQLLVGIGRVALGLAVWLAAHLVLQSAVYGTFGFPAYTATWRIWLLPVAWGLALALGALAASGGRSPYPVLRILAVAVVAVLLLREAALTMPGFLYPLWTGACAVAGLWLGYWAGRRAGRHRGPSPLAAV